MLFLLFQLGSDRYALAAREVVEVLPLLTLKQLPGAPLGVAGLLNYRGLSVPAIDLNERALGRPAARLVSTRVFIVQYPWAAGSTPLLGLIVERATEMLAKAPEEFQPARVQTEAAPYLGGVISDKRGLIQRVEIAELLTDELRAVLFSEEKEGAVS